MAGDDREAAEKTESKTEVPYNCLMFKDAGDLQPAFPKNTGTVISELEIEEQIVNLKLMVLFPLRPEYKPGLGDNLPPLPVSPIEPLPRATVGRREPAEDEERNMIEANTMNKYIYLSRAYVFEYQKIFPLMHQKNLEDLGENYGWMDCMELYRYAVKKRVANIPGFIPGLMSPE
ncbi:uncharacterized protein LAJ45_08427 [Morchella importuna]|nr:uncharacterized protein LAJ45_08427 [Morchella importuna]KAH8147599.1 hypothetical protein LAJ45_08427 [Morchella importuna]